MEHRISWLLKAQILIFTTILITPCAAEENSVISSFLQKFLRVFLQNDTNTNLSNRRMDNNNDLAQSTGSPKQNSKIVKIIKKRVEELKSLLEDGDELVETDDKITLRGNDETTVIEILPSNAIQNSAEAKQIAKTFNKQDPMKTTINKYKLLREQIKYALDEEEISEKTKRLILNTLDGMLAHLIESQCTWNSVLDRGMYANQTNTHQSLAKLQEMTNHQWKKLRQQYHNFLVGKKEKENCFINQFHQFFSNVINETYNLTDRYKIQCKLVEINKEDKQMLPRAVISNIKCDRFRICSMELVEFLTEFCTYVNDTAVSTFANYAAMYLRDVNVDFGVGSNVVLSVLTKLGTDSKKKIMKLFKKKIANLNLDNSKSKDANIKILSNFINDTVNEAKTQLKAIVIDNLNDLKSKLFVTVTEDLLVNLGIDLENLKQHYLETFCSMFGACNGKTGRKSADPWIFFPRANNDVYVKVQLSLDDELKTAVAKSGLLNMMENQGNFKVKIAPTPAGRHHKRAHKDSPNSLLSKSDNKVDKITDKTTEKVTTELTTSSIQLTSSKRHHHHHHKKSHKETTTKSIQKFTSADWD